MFNKIGKPAHRVGASDVPRGGSRLRQPGRRVHEIDNPLGKSGTIQVLLGNRPGAACLRQHFRVASLVVVERMGKRHQEKQHAIEAGKTLLEVKSSLPDREFQNWLREKSGLSGSRVRRYMEMAKQDAA